MIRHLYSKTAAKHSVSHRVQRLAAFSQLNTPSNGKPAPMKPFLPTEHGLSEGFLLTNFTKMKGWGCKVPQNKLLSYLSKLPKPVGIETPDVSTIKVDAYTLVSTVDFFYPLVESPYMFGRIAFCNTVSDLYAMGITNIKEVLMILGVSTDMN